MKKRLVSGLFAGGLLVGMLPGVASATPSVPPVGGCPMGGGWVLTGVITAGFPQNAPANGNFSDQNGDTWACMKENRGTGGTTWKDNTNPLAVV
jgi:hypothetical protein